MNLRDYQEAAVSACYAALEAGEGHPCIVLPTGTGKSLVIARIASDAVNLWGGRVIILAHVKELLEQNAAKLRTLAPGLDVGVYSAGLRSRDTNHAVIVAGIQSAFRRACEFGRRDLVIVDEAHRIPRDGEGMYQQFLEEARVVTPHQRVVGLTATPYRLQGGPLCAPGNTLTEVCYEAGLREMIAAGWLAPLISRRGIQSALPDMAGVHRRSGEFVAAEMEAAMMAGDRVQAACADIVALAAGRRSILIFAAGVAHAHQVCQHLRMQGQSVALITGETPAGERAETLARFRGEAVDLLGSAAPLRCLVNVDVLTTGFDAPGVDCVVLLRATDSPGLYVQMVGRGTRLAPGKTNCLILDYGGNVERHGPVDAVAPPRAPGERAGSNEPPVKACPNCRLLIPAGCTTCPECGAEIPIERQAPKVKASAAPILSTEPPRVEEFVIRGARYKVHEKRLKAGEEPKPPTMRVSYDAGMFMGDIDEWVCPEHGGYARGRFCDWWLDRSHVPPPRTTAEAVELAEAGALACPTLIQVTTKPGERFGRVKALELPAPPQFDYAAWRARNNAPPEIEAELAAVFGPEDLDEIPF